MIVILTKGNYIKRISPNSFKAQRRGGKGIIGGTTKEEDEIKQIKHANNHDELVFFTNAGRVFKLPVYELPQGSRQSKGQAIVNIVQLEKEESVTAILNAGEKYSGKFLFMATKKGTVKKTPIEDFKNVRKSGLIAIRLRKEDSLEWVRQTSGDDEVVLITKMGKCIRFHEKDARPMGRPSIGVRGIRLKEGDKVVEMDVIPDPDNTELLVVMENGLGKMTKLTDYRHQNRGGSGVKTANITDKTGRVVGAKTIDRVTDADLILMSKSGQAIRLHTSAIPSRGRATQGVYLMRLRPNDKVASLSIVELKSEEEILEEQQKLEGLDPAKAKPKKEEKKEEKVAATKK